MNKKKLRFMSNRYMKFLASIRFAIPVLAVFAVAMVAGTILESLYGAEYVRKAVYHTWWFYLIQLCISISVLLAMLDRVPLRKKLAGFYVVHIALLTIMAGSVVTRFWGIDGTIELRENEYASGVRLNEDYAYLWDGKKQHAYRLPETVGETNLDAKYTLSNGATATLVKYLPYAQPSTKWEKAPGFWGTTWILKNEQFEQRVELLDGPSSPARERFGPLQMEVVSHELISALRDAGPSTVLLDRRTGKRSALPVSKIVNAKMNLTYYAVESDGKTLKFFPRFSTKPVSNHLEVDRDSPFDLIDLSRFGESNTALLSRQENGKILMAFGKGRKWEFATYDSKPVSLPWMGFTLTLVDQRVDEKPARGYEEARPNREDEKNKKALLVKIAKDGRSEDLWLTNREAAGSELGLQESFIGSKELKLLMAMKLARFKMDLVPGTDKPASYESFIRLKEFGRGERDAHVYMNNPLKTNGYTFYQASYLQDDEGAYHSILSVNKDPGRPVKYAGSLLLVLGLIAHFSILYGFIKVDP